MFTMELPPSTTHFISQTHTKHAKEITFRKETVKFSSLGFSVANSRLTVRNSHDSRKFYVKSILADFRRSKIAIITILEAFNFDFLDTLENVKSSQKFKI